MEARILHPSNYQTRYPIPYTIQNRAKDLLNSFNSGFAITIAHMDDNMAVALGAAARSAGEGSERARRARVHLATVVFLGRFTMTPSRWSRWTFGPSM